MQGQENHTNPSRLPYSVVDLPLTRSAELKDGSSPVVASVHSVSSIHPSPCRSTHKLEHNPAPVPIRVQLQLQTIG